MQQQNYILVIKYPRIDIKKKNGGMKMVKCECLDCGHIVEINEHCWDTPCPECGGEMRREGRPGVGYRIT